VSMAPKEMPEEIPQETASLPQSDVQTAEATLPDKPAALTHSILKFYNRAGAPRIVDLGFDAQTDTDEDEEAKERGSQDLIGFPGERAPHVSYGFEGERWRIRNVVWVISQSELGQKLLDHTYRAGFRISFDSMVNTGEQHCNYLNYADRVIVLDSRASNDHMVAALALQLAFASAAVDGAYFDHGFTPPAALLAHRMAAAYAHAIQLQICFELRTSEGLPAKTDREMYWRLAAKEQPRLASGFAQAAINDMALTQGAAGAVVIREFYDYTALRKSYDAEVINFFRALPAAIMKDPKSMTTLFAPDAQALKLTFPFMAYALNHDPKLNLLAPANLGTSAEVVQAVAALQTARKNAGVKDRDSWQIKEA